MAEGIRKLLKDERAFTQLATAAFMESDSDKSGFVDEKELQKVMTKACAAMNCSKPSSGQIKELLKKIDQNKDGKVSYDEYTLLLKMILKRFLKTLEEEIEPVKPKESKDEIIEKQVSKQLLLFQKYLEESGISIAFQIVYNEIIAKKINSDDVFTYTAMRLRQIGKEVAHLLPANLAAKLTEN